MLFLYPADVFVLRHSTWTRALFDVGDAFLYCSAFGNCLVRKQCKSNLRKRTYIVYNLGGPTCMSHVCAVAVGRAGQ